MIAIAATLVGGVHGFAGTPQSSRSFARNVSHNDVEDFRLRT
jgi:hypothetical protein